MAGVNKVIIVGRLGNDPEMRTMPNGNAVASISVATSEVWNDKATGERREQTEWHRISLFGRNAEIAGQFLRKGREVYIEGKIRTRKWQDQNGQDRYSTEIHADSITLLGSRNDNNGDFGGNQGGWSNAAPQQNTYNQGNSGYGYDQTAQARPAATKPAPQAEPAMNNFDDDIPF